MNYMRRLKAQRLDHTLGEEMDLGGGFCVICGAEPPLVHDRMCENCLRKRITVVKLPDTVQHFRCYRCGLVEVQGRWIEIPDDDLWEELIQRSLEVHKEAEQFSLSLSPQRIDDRNTRLHLEVDAIVHGLQFTENHTLLARMSNGVCLTCTRRAGNYFEATVQLRSAGRKLEEHELTEMRASLNEMLSGMNPDPMFFVTNEGPVQGGYDLVVGSKSMARTWGRHLINRWGGHLKETKSVVGRKDGIDLSRLTLLYRRPAFDVGDVIRFRQILWRIGSWSSDGALIHKVERAERIGVSWRDLEKSVVIARQRDHTAVDLLNFDTSAGEFLNPRNWKMETIRLPYDHKGEMTLRLADIEGDWLALPRMAVDIPKEEEE